MWQGLPALGLDRQAMKGVLTDVANCAAFGSTVAGEVPRMSRAQAEDLLAEFGLLGQIYSLEELGGGAPAPAGGRTWVPGCMPVSACANGSHSTQSQHAQPM
jgi:hypothetical protein